MTARPPLNIAGLTREELGQVVRDLEQTCNTQDAGIHAAVVREGRLFLDNKAMKETLEKIYAARGVASSPAHLIAKEVLDKVKGES